MTKRLVLLALVFLGTSAYLVAAMQPERVALRQPFSTMPMMMDEWSGREAPPLTKDVLDVLGVDDYVNRFYSASSQDIVSLYIGYYRSQREGDTIHSPLNCLPGAGWQPVENRHVEIALTGGQRPIVVNQVVIQKGLEKQVVLYWYQSHGRVVASEYWSKAYMVADAIRYHRSDAALVRVVSPVLTSETGAAQAEARARRFVEVLFPRLERHLPS